ncbi:MAG: putative alpha-1,2-mannosidase [Phenylobacterium sp.]
MNYIVPKGILTPDGTFQKHLTHHHSGDTAMLRPRLPKVWRITGIGVGISCGLAFLATHSAFAATIPSTGPGGNSQWVDPFIGTGGDGHTFPGAVVPFGMVQLSPDTAAVSRGEDPQSEIYKHSAGYHYDDTTITGFSHTHFSGTGHSDLGDLLIMPMTGQAHSEPGTSKNPDSGYRSRFNHNRAFHRRQ